MNRSYSSLLVLRVALAAILLSSIASAQRVATPMSGIGGGAGGEIRFVENRGQVVDMKGAVRPDILYTLPSGGVRLFFHRTGVSYVYSRIEGGAGGESPSRYHLRADSTLRVSGYRMDMELIGSNPSAVVTADSALDGYSNYYLKHCPDGITQVQAYGRLVYHDVYPSIDLVFYGTDAGLKYDFVVRPGGRVSDIGLRYVGATGLRMKDGRVMITNPFGSLEEGSPLSYQPDGGIISAQAPRGIPTRYLLDGETIALQVDRYDSSRTLVIDPTLQWATYYGGEQNEGITTLGSVITADVDGGIAMTGATRSLDFPVTAGAFQSSFHGGDFDSFIFKLGSDGRRIWSTYFGGAGDEGVGGIAAVRPGMFAVSGWTNSTDFPVSSSPYQKTNAGLYDLYLAMFDATGKRVWATYYGGTSNDEAAGIAADGNGDFVITGYTGSSNFPVSPQAFQASLGQQSDAFIVKFSLAGSRIWSTYLGGSGTDYGYGIAVDNGGNVIVTGATYSINFPVTNGAVQGFLSGDRDLFIAMFDPSGARRWCTYYGGYSADEGNAACVDNDGNVVVVGHTRSYNFPTTPGAFQLRLGSDTADAFVLKLNHDGARQWSTLYGGNDPDFALGAACASSGDIFVAGFTNSTNFPVTPKTYQQALASSTDAFIVQLNPSGAQKWSTFYGGGGSDQAYSIVLDGAGNAIIGGITQSLNLPGTANGVQPALNGVLGDAFIAKFRDPCPTVKATITPSGPLTFCAGDSLTLTAPDGYTYQWIPGGKSTRSIVIKSAGTYQLTIMDAGGCVASASVQVSMAPKPVVGIVNRGPLTICQGDSVTLDATRPGLAAYAWSNGATTSSITVRQGGAYSVLAVDTGGCSARSDTVMVRVISRAAPTIAHGPLTFCGGDSVQLDAGPGFVSYRWSTGDSTQRIYARNSGLYKVKVMNANGCWSDADSVIVRAYAVPKLVITPLRPATFCQGDSTVLVAPSGFLRYRWSNGDTTRTITVRQGGAYVLIATDSNGCNAFSDMKVTVFARPAPMVTSSGPTHFCQGESVVLDAGAGYSYYLWSTGESTRSITVKESGLYSVTVANDLGCPGQSEVVDVDVDPRPNVTINGPVTICRGSTAVYNVASTPGMRYSWTLSSPTGEIIGGTDGRSVTVKWDQLGSAVLSLRVENDQTHCAVDTAISIHVDTLLIPVITSDRSLRLCAEGSQSITLDAGTYSSYQWSTGATTRTITVSTPGEYSVLVADAAGCSGLSRPVVVTSNPRPAPQIATPNGLSFCKGDTVTLDAGPGYTRYLWSNGATVRRITVREPGSYSVVVTDSNGCDGASAAVTVTVEPKPLPLVQGPRVVCRNSTIRYSVGSTPGHTYTWNVEGGTISGGQGTPEVAVIWGSGGAGAITMNESNASGCSGAVRYDVSVGDQLQPLIVQGSVVTLCPGKTVELDAGAGYQSYQWSNGATTQTITVADSGTFSVWVADEGGCTGMSEPTSVVLGGAVRPQIAASATRICPDGTVTLDAGAGYQSYQWSNGATTQTITVADIGTYHVDVVDPNGCSGRSAPVTITRNIAAAPVVTAHGPLELCEGESVMLEAEAGYRAYRWSNGDTSRSINVSRAGEYTVSVVDEDGCAGLSAGTAVTVHPMPPTPTILRKRDSLIVASPAFSYRWSHDGEAIAGVDGGALHIAVPGRYVVAAMNEFGCLSVADTFDVDDRRVIWFDTVDARVGEHARLALRVYPPLTADDQIRDYHIVFHIPIRSIFLHRAISPEDPSGGIVSMAVTGEGKVTLDRPMTGSILLGDTLLHLEFEGLATGQPLNIMSIDSALLGGGLAPEGGLTPGTGNGLVILEGCDIGTSFGAGKRVRIDAIRPNPIRDEATLVYRAPAGSQPRLLLRDMTGREFASVPMPAGTGELQEVRLPLGDIDSGVYLMELQQGAERSVMPVIIRK